ncbi:PMS1 protein homolog 1-like [Patiria miniata]|uniref:HMG box domain-containing protein n=1 Tax=Patiria miniata TaxID=46514 RepID=A0A913YYW7_PATMI|nr:PMS1 protein homolog 1-like [Patiria miniata]
MACMRKLSSDTIRLVTSSQVITSVVSVIKELIENSLDAGSDNIEIKLENYGFDKIEVRDNGSGIKPIDAPFMARRHFTSKISQHADLEYLATYGFRGEALGSLCAMSSVTIVTKTQDDEFGRHYVLDHEGEIVTSKPSHLGNGTTVTAMHLFKNVPVRKQYYTNAKRRRDELKKVEELVMSYGVIRPAVRFALSHNKSSLWQKCKVANHKAALINTWGSSVMSHMQYIQRLDDETEVRIEGFVPSLSADSQSASRAVSDRCWIAINGRPIIFKDIEKMVKQSYCQAVKHDMVSVRYLVMFISISLPQHHVDVNLEPNKTKVMLQNKEVVFSVLSDLLDEVYGRKADDHIADVVIPNSTHQQANNIQPVDNLPTQLGFNDRTLCNTNTAFEDNHVPTCTSDGGVKNENTWSIEKLDCERESAVYQSINLGKPSHQDHNHDVPVCKATEEPKGIAETPCSAQNVPTTTKNLPSASNDQTVGDSIQQNIFQLNFSIFDDVDFELEKVDETAATIALDEAKCPESDLMNQNVLHQADNTTMCDYLIEETAGNVQSVTSSVNLTDWSKGRGLTNKDGRPLEPATLHIPRKAVEERLVTNHIEPGQLSTNQRTSNSESPFQVPADCTNTNQNKLARIPHTVTLGNSMTSSSSTNQEADDLTPTNGKRTSPKRRPSLEKKIGKGTMYDLICGSPIRRPQSSYEFFCKEMRPLVLGENPRASFNDITKVVAEKWRQLEEMEKAKYEEKSRRDTERHRNQLEAAQKKLGFKRGTGLEAPPSKKRKITLASNQGLIDKMLLSQQQRESANQLLPTKAPDIPTVNITFNLIGLRREFETHQQKRKTDPDQRLNLIGQLASHDVWLAHHGNQVVVFNQYRVEETLLFHRLLAHHMLPCQPVEVPVVLSPSMVGGHDNWATLLEMSKRVNPPDPAMYYTDTRLTANGFTIKQTVDSETVEVKVQVIAMATTVSCYGIQDLQELLELITTKQSCTLSQCRPLKVANYLKGEAVRMARNLPSTMLEEDVQNVIERMKQLPNQCKTCLHNQPFTYPLFVISESQV